MSFVGGKITCSTCIEAFGGTMRPGGFGRICDIGTSLFLVLYLAGVFRDDWRPGFALS